MTAWTAGRGFRQELEPKFICNVCGNFMDREGRMCRNCLARIGAKSAAAALLLAVIGVAAWYYMHPKPLPPVRDAGSVGAAVRGKGGWFYFQTQDPLVDDTTKHARLQGTLAANQTLPPAPHPPAQHQQSSADAPMLDVSSSPRYGNQIVFTLPKSADGCPGHCAVQLGFDQAPAQTYRIRDNFNPQTVILGADAFDPVLQNLRKAHELTLSLSQDSKPGPTAVFIVDGFKPEQVR